MKNIGTITIGFGSENPRTIQLTDMVRSAFKDNRLITMTKDEEGGFLLSVENPESSGRWPKSQMYLSEGSMIGLFLTMTAFFKECHINIEEAVDKSCLNGKNYLYKYNHKEE